MSDLNKINTKIVRVVYKKVIVYNRLNLSHQSSRLVKAFLDYAIFNNTDGATIVAGPLLQTLGFKYEKNLLLHDFPKFLVYLHTGPG